MMYSKLSNEEIVIRELSNAITSMSMCMPLLEEMKGKMPQEVINLLDELNRLSVMY